MNSASPSPLDAPYCAIVTSQLNHPDLVRFLEQTFLSDPAVADEVRGKIREKARNAREAVIWSESLVDSFWPRSGPGPMRLIRAGDRWVVDLDPHDFVEAQFLQLALLRRLASATLDPWTFGSCQGRGTRQAILALWHLVMASLQNGGEAHLRFTDVQNFYWTMSADTVTRGLSPHSILTRAIDRVAERAAQVNPHGARRCVPPGHPMASAASAIGLDKILSGSRKLCKNHTRISVYVDDIAIVSTGSEGASVALTEIEKALGDAGMSLNQSKTREHRVSNGSPWHYLGHQFQWDRVKRRLTVRPQEKAFQTLDERLGTAIGRSEIAAIINGWMAAYLTNDPETRDRVRQIAQRSIT